MDLPEGKKIYFASDFHLGVPDRASSREREKYICTWLDEISKDAEKIYLVGDIFDVWFEYRNVVPKGYTRFLGKLAELTDKGISIEAFTGNHDLWMHGYFEEELNIPVHHDYIERTFNGKKFLIAHGDGIGPGDYGYKLLKKVLKNPVSQWLYRRLHPDTGVGMAGWFSRLGPKHFTAEEHPFYGPDKEWQVQFALTELKKQHVDYFIFGHRHVAIEYPLSDTSMFINLGDWIQFFSYAVFDGKTTTLQYYKKNG
ncbi:MAG: UDP-2,3-diacylglucosamine diphosphatase [Sphingobacteriales bacterium]|nr:MAG: UDP-2,3-diacylglucosamine diphosphatase [Sphingobacteriales bacterium]